MKKDIMKIDYSKICSYQNFLYSYAPIINSEKYDLIMEQSKHISQQLSRKYISDPCYAVSFIKDYFRNEKNALYRHLATINTIFNEELIYKVLKQHNMDIETFIAKINSYIILSKKVPNLSFEDDEIVKILSTIATYHGYKNNNLIILKIYELGYKEHMCLETSKQRSK